MKRLFLLGIVLLSSLSVAVFGARQMERLDRGLVAVKVSGGVYLSWRLMATDNHHATKFNLYRDGVLIQTIPATAATSYTDAAGTTASTYRVKALVGGVELNENAKSVPVWANQYKSIQLQLPPAGTTPPSYFDNRNSTSPVQTSYPNGEPYTYTPNDCSVGDVDGDGEYEIIVKWDPTNSRDNSFSGMTGNVFIDAYKLDGTFLWRIDLGRNIRAGAHYTQFMVYDFDGDGKAEIVCKTAPGTKDGENNYVIMGSDDPSADYRNAALNSNNGYVLSGPEYLTLFDGVTGKELHTVAYKPARGTVSSWGDSYGNRVDRFLACVAYLDGVRPSVVMCRGYYTRTTLAAYDVVNKKLVEKGFYDSGTTSGVGAYGQGNHNLSVADVAGDGKDAIIYGSSAFVYRNNSLELLYRTGLGHGDAMHVSDLDPDRPGLEVWEVHEESSAFSKGYEMHDAKTGAIIWSGAITADNGRGLAADIDPDHRGFEMWSSSGTGVYNCKGVKISDKKPSTNFRVYWDGDLQDELLDGQSNPSIRKWSTGATLSAGKETTLLNLSNTSSCNSTKATPNLSADILGDWREEVIMWETGDPSKLRIYTTTTPTTNRVSTLMHDPGYRLAVAWQNVAYNQPPHLGYYLPDSVAKLAVVPATITANFDPNGGKFSDGTIAVKTTQVAPDASFDAMYVQGLTNGNSIFKGWSVSENASNTGAVMLVASWEATTVVIAFNPQGGHFDDAADSVKCIETPLNTQLGQYAPNVTRENHTFLGWFYANGTQCASNTILSLPTTLSARWSRNDIVVTFDPQGGRFADGGTSTKNINAPLNTSLIQYAPSVVKEGYMFLGWYFNGGELCDTGAILEASAALTARWIQQHIVGFDGESVTSWDTLVNHNTLAAMPVAPVREGYTFVGWAIGGVIPWDFETPVTEDIFLIAKWQFGTGIGDDKWPNLLLYPNPASDVVTLRGLEGNEVIRVINAMGQEVFVWSAAGPEEQLQLDRLAPGIYYVLVVKDRIFKVLKLVIADK